MWITEVCYHSSLDGSITICMGSLTICSKGTGPPPAIKLDLFILGEIYEALSATNQMEPRNHSFTRIHPQQGKTFILFWDDAPIATCTTSWLIAGSAGKPFQETANLILDELPQSFPCASQMQYFNTLATVCRKKKTNKSKYKLEIRILLPGFTEKAKLNYKCTNIY